MVQTGLTPWTQFVWIRGHVYLQNIYRFFWTVIVQDLRCFVLMQIFTSVDFASPTSPLWLVDEIWRDLEAEANASPVGEILSWMEE